MQKSIGARVGLVLCLVSALFSAVNALGEAGTTSGSWGQINQPISRTKGWVRYVDNSPFCLGEKSVLEAEPEPSVYQQSYGTYPSIDGSTVAVPMAIEFARQHLDISDIDAESFVFFSTTHSAYMNLIEKKPNIASQLITQNTILDESQAVNLVIATEPSDEELQAAEVAGVSLIVQPVCLDAFVFITHKDNPVESLTIDQIQKIYTGEITSWEAVGGEDILIEPYEREKNSGSQTAMENFVMKGLAPSTLERKNLRSGYMGSLVESIATYENNKYSIGYTYQYYIDTLYKNDDIKVLAIEGIAPTPENLQNKSYPFTTAYYGVIRAEDKNQEPGRFLEWMLSDEGQLSIQQAKYIPVRQVEWNAEAN